MKTVRGFHKLNSQKIRNWLKQIAASQIGWRDEQHLLTVVDIEAKPYQAVVLKIDPDNISKCIEEWSGWFQTFGTSGWRQNIFQWIQDYQSGSITFMRIMAMRRYKEPTKQITQEAKPDPSKKNGFAALEDDSSDEEDD